MHNKNEKKERIFHCPVEATLSVIGGKYKPIILYDLHWKDTSIFGTQTTNSPSYAKNADAADPTARS